MKIAHKNISMIDTFANNVLSLLSASAVSPPAKALITKYAIATTTKIKTMTRGLMNSSILPSIQLNIPDTSFKPTVGAIGIFVDADCDMEWNGMEWNGMEWNEMYLIYCPYNIVHVYCGDAPAAAVPAPPA